jgi:hypothetical protein
MFDSNQDGPDDPNDDYDCDAGLRAWLTAKLDAIAQCNIGTSREAAPMLCDALAVLHDYRLRHARVPRLGRVGLRLDATRQRLEMLIGPL